MGRQRGPVYFTGQFNDLRLSVNDRKGIVGMSIPISKDRIMHSEEYELTRKYINEFKGVSKAMKAFKLSLGPGIDRYVDRYFMSRLVKVGRTVMAAGAGNLGEREFNVMANVGKLREIRLDRNEFPDQRFRMNASNLVTVNVDRNTATMVVPSFRVKESVQWVEGATHVRLRLVVGALPDFEFQGVDEGYVPVVASLVGAVGTAETGLISRDAGTHPGFTLVSSLPGLVVLGMNAGLVVSLEQDFVKLVNSNENLMEQGNAAQLVGIY